MEEMPGEGVVDVRDMGVNSHELAVLDGAEE